MAEAAAAAPMPPPKEQIEKTLVGQEDDDDDDDDEELSPTQESAAATTTSERVPSIDEMMRQRGLRSGGGNEGEDVAGLPTALIQTVIHKNTTLQQQNDLKERQIAKLKAKLKKSKSQATATGAPRGTDREAEDDIEEANRKHRKAALIKLALLLLVLIYVGGAILGAARKLDLSWGNAPPPGVQFVNPHDHSPVGSVSPAQLDMANNAATSLQDEAGRLSSILLWPVRVSVRMVRTRLPSFVQSHADVPNLAVYPMVDNINSEECIGTKPQDIIDGRILGGTVDIRELRISLLYHLSSKRFKAICAMHVGIPTCYCILNMRIKQLNQSATAAAAASPSAAALSRTMLREGEYLEMFNPVIISVVRNQIAQVQEKNSYCKKQYFAKRFRYVTVEYLDAKGDLWERNFNGTHAFSMQNVEELHNGIRSCLDDSTDALLALMRNRLGGSPEKGDFSKQLLFKHPEAHLTHRPALPAALPPLALPDIGDKEIK